jgi:hypothetical protein
LSQWVNDGTNTFWLDVSSKPSSFGDISATNLTVTGTATYGNVAATSNVTAGNLVTSGNLSFTGTSNRITGDFSNATVANRVMLQTSTANSRTVVGAIPTGTGTGSTYVAYGSADPANSSFLSIYVDTSGPISALSSGITGTGSYLPLTMYTGGSERLRIDTSGNVGIGTTSPSTYGKLGIVAADGTAGVVASGTTGMLRMYGYVSGAGGAYIDSANATQSAYLPIQINGLYSVFATGGTERMRIDSSGNVGIGTSSPAATFVVNSGQSLFGTNTNDSYNTVQTGSGLGIAGAATYYSEINHNLYYNSGWKSRSGGPTAQINLQGGSATNYTSAIRFLVDNNPTSTSAGATANLAEAARFDSSGNFNIGSITNTAGLRYFDVYNTSTTNATDGAIIRLITADVPRTSTSSVDIYKRNNGQFTISQNDTNAAAYMSFSVNGERMRIDSSGRVTIPNQPAFWAYNGATNPTLTATPLGLVFNSATTNVGSYYSTSTGRFTAPVAGTYLFNWTLIQQGALGGPVAYIYKNGTIISPGAISYASQYNAGSMTAILTLAVNDYVQIFAYALNATSPVLDMGWMTFSGHLIG